MIAVIGLSAVAAVISVTVLAATITGLGFTSADRAGVQATAAAEAGIDFARAGLERTNGCDDSGARFTSVGAAQFTATISHSLTESGPWTEQTCPPDDAKFVRISSVGTAADPGVAGASAGDAARIDAVFRWEPLIGQVPLAGAAVYAHTIDGALKKFRLTSADASVATSVMIKNGDVECSNGARIAGDLIMGDGDAVLDMCNVVGSVHVNGLLNINKSTIGGSIKSTGLLSIANSSYKESRTSSGVSVAPPVIPEWTDVGWNPELWVEQGYTVVEWTGECAIAKGTASSPWESLSGYTTPTVINFLTKCPTTPVTTSNSMNTVQLNTDIVLVAEEFIFDRLYFTATEPRDLIIMVPDDIDDGAPTCNPVSPLTGDVTLSNETNFGSNLAAMVYTPCRIDSYRDGFRGQLYGGEVEFHMQASLQFVPVGFPGFDLSDGLTTSVQSGAVLGDFVNVREIADAG